MIDLRKPFSVTNQSGLTVRGMLIYAAEDGAKRPTVIMSHGFNGCCADLYGNGEAFARAGINCCLFDFCGGGEHGTSDGRLQDMMTIQSECADLKAVVAYVRDLPETDAGNLFLMGESQGGLVTTLVAEEQPNLYRGLILWYPALMIPEHSAERLRRGVSDVFGIVLSPDFDRLAAQIDPWRDMPAFGGSVQLVEGDCDPIVPLDICKRAKSLFPNASLMVLHGARHGFVGGELHDALEASIGFVKSNAF